MSKFTKKNKEHLDSMVIGQGHTIMAGYIPEAVGAQTFSENYYKWKNPTPDSIAQFGFWGGDIDYNTYYPNLDKSELTPKDEEFIEPMFRLLSETIVSKNWNPTDFGQKGVLKASMKMLLGQTVNCDHETNIGNAIGAVSQVMWQESYKDGSFTIPAGINGILKIDGKANPRIARGILMEPPSIHSNSVTVQFKWDKSHPQMEDNEFYQKLGTYDSKGVMVRRIVTEIVRYLETSLVSHGADSFAQKIGSDGKIINPTFAKRTWASYEEYRDDKSKQYFFTDYKSDLTSYQEKDDTQGSFNDNDAKDNQSNEKNSMNELQKFLESLFGDNLLTLEEGKEMNQETVVACIQSLVSSRNELQTSVDNLTTEKNSLTEQVTNLNAEVANLKEMATVGKNHIASLREDAVATYKKLMGDNADETIVTMLNAETTGITTLVSLTKDYQARLEEKFPLTCSKCGSKDVNRASSVTEDDTQGKKTTDGADTTKNSELPSTKNVIDNLYRNKIK
nr:MAG: hypothetical protein [Bacteriophage sp.]UWI23006.1 MAG: hypothetical protein [Bacteriophage sp.]